MPAPQLSSPTVLIGASSAFRFSGVFQPSPALSGWVAVVRTLPVKRRGGGGGQLAWQRLHVNLAGIYCIYYITPRGILQFCSVGHPRCYGPNGPMQLEGVSRTTITVCGFLYNLAILCPVICACMGIYKNHQFLVVAETSSNGVWARPLLSNGGGGGGGSLWGCLKTRQPTHPPKLTHPPTHPPTHPNPP